MSGDPKQSLILGGGFAGVYTARYLEKFLRPEEASITLIRGFYFKKTHVIDATKIISAGRVI